MASTGLSVPSMWNSSLVNYCKNWTLLPDSFSSDSSASVSELTVGGSALDYMDVLSSSLKGILLYFINNTTSLKWKEGNQTKNRHIRERVYLKMNLLCYWISAEKAMQYFQHFCKLSRGRGLLVYIRCNDWLWFLKKLNPYLSEFVSLSVITWEFGHTLFYSFD